MPRLLLVDDNPSIHKIAETLLAPTDIELVCVEGAMDAMNRVAQGEHFDVALLDTAMPEMDGWELLKQLRMHPATAGIPIAMMAGVLDTVDPRQIEHPSIQGFLKKPVELRDLGTRVHALLLTPVVPPAPPAQEFSPFSTLPAIKLSELGRVTAEAPATEIASDILIMEEADLWPEVSALAGTRTEDLSPFSEIPPEEHLDLEEFDLESLKSLVTGTPPVASAPAPEPVAAALPSAFDLFEEAPFDAVGNEPSTQELPDLGPESEPTFDPSAFEGLDSLSDEALVPPSSPAPQETPLSTEPEFTSDLGEVATTPDIEVMDWSPSQEPMLGLAASASEGLDSLSDEALVAPPAPAFDEEPVFSEPDFPSDLGEVTGSQEAIGIDWTRESEPTLNFTANAPSFVADHLEAPAEEPIVEEKVEAADLDLAALAAEVMTGEAIPVPTIPATPVVPEPLPIAPPPSGSAPDPETVLQALLANPALMDQLVRAIATKLSDQALREIAWEVMPELAERLNRH